MGVPVTSGGWTSIVFCPTSPRMDSCALNGMSMYFHGIDEGRDLWLIQGTTHVSGTLVCNTATKTYSFAVNGNGGMQWGDCS